MTHPNRPGHTSYDLFPFGPYLTDPRGSDLPSELARLLSMDESHIQGPSQDPDPDPDPDFMYRMPLPMGMVMGMAPPPTGPGMDGRWEDTDRGKKDEGSQDLDPNALAERLRTLKGLQGGSTETLQTQVQTAQVPNPLSQSPQTQLEPPFTPTRSPNHNTHSPRTPRSHTRTGRPAGPGPRAGPSPGPVPNLPPEAYLSPNQLPYALRRFPTVEELRPSDSISMYRPTRAPSHTTHTAASGRSRRGGTNVDGQEPVDYSPVTEDGEASFVTGDGGMTMQTPRSLGYLDQATAQPTSQWTTGTLAGNMYNMRDRLLKEAELQHHISDDQLKKQLAETAELATTLVKLEKAEDQLRTLQATLIAEQVARTQMEREAEKDREDFKDCKDELASAIRALRRARDEGLKGDEEKKRLQRCFETTRNQLHKYHEELKVRDARARGREEGRAEAWKEAEMWMGGSPPIPINPIQSIPAGVFRQTPMMGTQALDGTYPAQQYQQPQMGQYTSPPQQQPIPQPQPQFQPQPQVGQPQMPQGMVSPPAQVYPATTGGQQQPQAQGYFQPMMVPGGLQPGQPPQQSMQGQVPMPPTQPMQSQATGQQPMMSQPTGPMPELQPQHTAQTAQPLQPQHTAQTMQPLQAQHTAQTMQPQHTAQTLQPQQTAQTIQPQLTGFQPPMFQDPTDLSVPGMMMPGLNKPLTPPHLVGVPTGPTVPQWQPPPQPQTQNGYAPGSRSVPQRKTPLPPAQSIPQRAATVLDRPTGRQATQSTKTVRGASTVHVPQPESVARPHPAESYLDRAAHDPRLKDMLSGAQSKTIHTSEFPATERNGTVRGGGTEISSIDKPLPNPFSHSSVLGKSQSTKRPSRHTHSHSHVGHGLSRRISLSEGLQPMSPHGSHGHREEQITDGRYPTFPHLNASARGHSRHSSFGSVDPAKYPLPPSVDPSMMQTPRSTARHQSLRHTPAPSTATRSRSRIAGALRTDGDLDQGDLSQIEEEEAAELHAHVHPSAQTHSHHGHTDTRAPTLDARSRGTASRQGQGYAPPQPPVEMTSPKNPMESMVMRNMTGPSEQHVPRKAPTMPPMRFQPKPVMPSLLGGGKGNRAQSELHGPSGGDRGRMQAPPAPPLPFSQVNESATALHDPRGPDDPPHSHSLYLPPSMANRTRSGESEEINHYRHSALGLEGLEGARAPGSVGVGDRNALGHGQANNGHSEQRSRSGTMASRMRAPTITIQPPSSRSNNLSQRPSIAPSMITGFGPDSPERTIRQTEFGMDGPFEASQRGEILPEQVPLPPSMTTMTGPGTVPVPATTRSHGTHQTHQTHHSAGTHKTQGTHGRPPTQPTVRSTHRHEVDADTFKSPRSVRSRSHGRSVSEGDALRTIRGRLESTDPNIPPGPLASSIPQPGPHSHSRSHSHSHAKSAQMPPQPHEIPLPKPRSTAPTAYDAPISPGLTSPAQSTRSRAPTNGGMPKMHKRAESYQTQGTIKTMPSVSVIDYAALAQAQPLPPSRAATSPATQISDDDQDRVVDTQSTRKSVRRKPIPGPVHHSQASQGTIDPRKIPLPVSRPPTRQRASTYARTEGTIEEVTEEESGRENRGRKRW